jgi:hypothetical protein
MKLKLVVLLLIGALLCSVLTPVAGGTAQAASARSHAASVHSNANPAAFDKTRFVAHLAFAAFLTHYIYKKYKEGKLSRRHLFTVAKAAIAALLAYHEIKKAYDIAKSSNSKTLQALISPITKLTAALDATASKLRHGDTSTIASADSDANSLQGTASHTQYSFQPNAPGGYNPGF